MNAHGVEVFNRADDDAVVVLITDNLHLVFLPADEGFVDKKLMGRREI